MPIRLRPPCPSSHAPAPPLPHRGARPRTWAGFAAACCVAVAATLLAGCATPTAAPATAMSAAPDAFGARVARAARLPAGSRGDLLISERQLQAAMLAHNRGTGNRAALLFCVEHLQLGSHIPVATCGSVAQLVRAGLLHYRELPRRLRQQARRAGEATEEGPPGSADDAGSVQGE